MVLRTQSAGEGEQHRALCQGQYGRSPDHPGQTCRRRSRRVRQRSSSRARCRRKTQACRRRTRAWRHPEAPAPESVTKSARKPPAPSPSFRWPVRGRVIADRPSEAGRAAKRRHQSGGAGGHAGQGGRGRRGRLCRQRVQGLRQSALVRHANGYVTAYAHASEVMVKRGDTIRRGQTIAKSGQTGNVGIAAIAFRDPQRLDADRSGAISRQSERLIRLPFVQGKRGPSSLCPGSRFRDHALVLRADGH